MSEPVYPLRSTFMDNFWMDGNGDIHPVTELVDETTTENELYRNVLGLIKRGLFAYSPAAKLITPSIGLMNTVDFILSHVPESGIFDGEPGK